MVEVECNIMTSYKTRDNVKDGTNNNRRVIAHLKKMLSIVGTYLPSRRAFIISLVELLLSFGAYYSTRETWSLQQRRPGCGASGDWTPIILFVKRRTTELKQA